MTSSCKYDASLNTKEDNLNLCIEHAENGREYTEEEKHHASGWPCSLKKRGARLPIQYLPGHIPGIIKERHGPSNYKVVGRKLTKRGIKRKLRAMILSEFPKLKDKLNDLNELTDVLIDKIEEEEDCGIEEVCVTA